MKRMFMLSGILLLMSACGIEEPLAGEESKNPSASEQKPSSEDKEEDVMLVSGRGLHIKLEQTAEPVKRNEEAAAVKESTEFKDGLFGEPTEELAEDMAVQQIEGQAVSKAIDLVYGGDAEFDKVGILFYENQASGAEQSGIWLGIKELDERVDELVAVLQKRVDAGEILAEPIYIYKVDYTQADLNNLMYQASKKLKPMVEAHTNPDSVFYSISTDTLTGAIEIGHNFLTRKQIDELKNAFPDQKVIIEQEGVMVPVPGDPTVKYPEPAIISEPSNEGYYIISLEDERFLAVAAASNDFSGNGGEDEFYSAIYFDFTDAGKLLEVGRRVQIEAAGGIQESYPGQGRAVFVEVLPTYQPGTADLTEAEVVRRALEGLDQQKFGVPAIRSIAYSAEDDTWKVVFKSWDHETEKTIEDKK